ncbi:MAG: elongation factor G, partial [Deltaproteobacteria bacterium]
ILSRKIIPVYCGSAEKNIGMAPLLESIVNLLPSPLDRGVVFGVEPSADKVKERKPDSKEPLSALVFKTIVDPFAGRLSIFRVFSGEFNSDSNIFNSSQKEKEKIGQIFQLVGKQQHAINPAVAGEIAAVAKLRLTTTGDTLSDEGDQIIFDSFNFPSPSVLFAVKPKGKSDEEKIATSIAKLQEEDPTIKLQRELQTKEVILMGLGQRHLEVTIEKLKRKYGVEVELTVPKVPYQETIRSKAQAQGKYKKQSGGRGQYGDTWTEVEPLPRGNGFEFVNKITGGVIPRQYIPAVEKGIRETMAEGILAGYPVVDLKATLYDGTFHDVDSSDMAFKIAGALGFKKGFNQADPVLLEPIMSVEISVPDEYTGDVIGDLNSRRGKVIGVEPKEGIQIIKSQVPMSEVLRYEPDLRSMTQGRGAFTMQLSHYEELPSHISEKVIAASKTKEEQ